MGPMNGLHNSQIVYFEREGRENLPDVLRVIKKQLKKRVELRPLKLVIFTAIGEGPALAYNALCGEFNTQIVAVTFPVDFLLKQGAEHIHPRIPAKVKKFFDGVGIKVLDPSPLPFDLVEGLQVRNDQMRAVRGAIGLFGGSFVLLVEAVLRACDSGVVEVGEMVLAMTGDCAALVSASTTAKFLSSKGLAIKEIFCKPRSLTIAKPGMPTSVQPFQQELDIGDRTSKILRPASGDNEV